MKRGNSSNTYPKQIDGRNKEVVGNKILLIMGWGIRYRY